MRHADQQSTEEEQTRHGAAIKVAIIAGVFTVIAACIGAIATIAGGAWILVRDQETTPTVQAAPAQTYSTSTPEPTQGIYTTVAPSETPRPTHTAESHLTSTPQTVLPTFTPSPQPSAAPPASAIFYDNFDAGMSSAWQLESGDPSVVNGRLTGRDEARITLSVSLPTNYAIEFRNWPWEAWWTRARAGDMLLVCVESDSRMLGLGWGNFDSEWLVYESGQWQGVPGSYTEHAFFGDDTELRVKVSDGVYSFYINGEQVSSIVDRSFSCNRVGFRFGEGTSSIDDFLITELTP